MYQNPIPNLDDVRKAKAFILTPVSGLRTR